MRFFLSRLAREAWRGRIEVHAYCLMNTHFHLLLRSPTGELSEAMRLVQNAYSRRFNREHRRDGALVRGRFLSKPVRSLGYRRILVRYIDANPVIAGLARGQGAYPYGSAAASMGDTGPLWLSRGWVESEACAIAGAVQFSPAVYKAAFQTDEALAIEELDEFVEARIARSAQDPLDDLIGVAPPQVQVWMQRKARRAARLDWNVTGGMWLHVGGKSPANVEPLNRGCEGWV